MCHLFFFPLSDVLNFTLSSSFTILPLSQRLASNPSTPSAPACPLFSCCDPQGNGAYRLESDPTICGPSVWTGRVSLGLHSQPLLARPHRLTFSSEAPCAPPISANSTFCHPANVFVLLIIASSSFLCDAQKLYHSKKMYMLHKKKPEPTFCEDIPYALFFLMEISKIS